MPALPDVLLAHAVADPRSDLEAGDGGGEGVRVHERDRREGDGRRRRVAGRVDGHLARARGDDRASPLEQRDPADASRGTVRWELDADGEFRTQLAGKDDVRAFTCGFVVRGFDLDEGGPLERPRVVEETQLDTEAIPIGGAP